LRKKGMLVVISGLHGSGKTSVAKRLAAELKLERVSAGEIFRRIALEENITLLELTRRASEEDSIDRQIDSRIVEEIKQGERVIDGMLSAWFASNSPSARIFLKVSDEVRFRRIAERDGISLEEAKRETRLRELAELERFKRYYGITPHDVEDSCHLVLDTDHLPEESVYRILKTFVEEFFGSARG